jgi:hypothetical protein
MAWLSYLIEISRMDGESGHSHRIHLPQPQFYIVWAMCQGNYRTAPGLQERFLCESSHHGRGQEEVIVVCAVTHTGLASRRPSHNEVTTPIVDA